MEETHHISDPKLSRIIERLNQVRPGGRFGQELMEMEESGEYGLWYSTTASLYRMDDYFFRCSLMDIGFDCLSQILKDMRPFGLRFAPEWILSKRITISSILVTRITGFVSHRDAYPYMSSYRNHVSETAKKHFMEDVEKMMSHNYFNNAILNAQNWFINPDTGEFYIDSWAQEDVQMVYSPLDKRDLLKELERMLYMNY